MIKVDPEFQWILDKFPWRVTPQGYAALSRWSRIHKGKKKTHYLHRVLWYAKYRTLPKMIDHINEDKLDCRFENLRPASPRLNRSNIAKPNKSRSLPKGVTFCPTNRGGSPRLKPYLSTIFAYGFRKYLGNYVTAEEASQAYEEARQTVIEFESL
jgi:hypothetical protein